MNLTTPPFLNLERNKKAFVESAVKEKIERLFNLFPDNLIAFFMAESGSDIETILDRIDDEKHSAHSLFSERLYEASTILKDDPTKKPFRSDKLAGMSLHFGLEPEPLAEKLRAEAKKANVNPSEYTILMRSLVTEVIEWSFEEARRLLRAQMMK